MPSMERLIHSIRLKLSVFFLMMVIVPLIFVGVFSYNKMSEIDKLNTSKYIINNLKNVSDNIDDILYNIEYLSVPIVTDSEFIDNLYIMKGSLGISTYEEQKLHNDVLDYLFEKNFINKYINTIYLYSYISSEAYSSLNIDEVFSEEDILSERWFNDFEESQKNNLKWKITKSLKVEHSGGGYIVSHYKTLLKSLSENTPLGIISFNMNEAHIYKILNNIKFKPSSEIFVVDKLGDVVSHTDRNFIGKNLANETYVSDILGNEEREGFNIYNVDGRRMFVAYYTSKYTGWKYVAAAPVSEVTTSANELRKYFFLAYIILLIIIVFSILLISYWLYKPMRDLFMHIKSASEGNLSSTINHKRKDEFGFIFTAFNNMLSNIENLINQVYVQSILRKEAHLKTIQVQINEHFLYNTLDFINWSARRFGADDICKMTFYLSKFFRLSLSGGNDVVTVKEVVEMLDSYLSIIKLRFKDRLLVDMQFDKDIEDVKVLKYIFQPIVENAVVHGVERRKGTCLIRIVFRRHGDLIYFSVTDNGVGIPESKLAKILESLELPAEDINNGEYFGLRTVNSHIKLYYNQQNGLKISSAVMKGTSVEFEIPAIIPEGGEPDVQNGDC